MKKRQEIVAFYLVTGFLESGKTQLIRSMLEDENFSRGQRTLILSAEEGIEELEDALLKKQNATLITLDSPEEFNVRHLMELDMTYHPERVIMEYNSTWGLEPLATTDLPEAWRYVQVVTLADATTYENYLTNMRKLMTEPMKEADLVIVNRCQPEHPKSQWRRGIKALNPQCNIIFENVDGTSEDGVSDEDLPYDMSAAVIDIPEEHFGTFYMDSMEHPQRYDKRTVRLVGQAYPDRGFPQGFYYFSRLAMTCCADDIARIGWVCKGGARQDKKGYIRLTAHCGVMTRGEDAVLALHEMRIEPAEAPKEELVSFT